MAIRDLIPRNLSRGNLTPNEHANPLAAFHREVERLFDDFDAGFGTPRAFGFPHVEMTETDREVKLEAELPGMEEKDVELLLQNGVVTIRGERKGESEDSGRHVSERFYGRFERRFTLPVEVQEDKVSATFKNGVLSVTLPKSANAVEKMRRIPISGK